MDWLRDLSRTPINHVKILGVYSSFTIFYLAQMISFHDNGSFGFIEPIHSTRSKNLTVGVVISRQTKHKSDAIHITFFHHWFAPLIYVY